MISMVLGHDVLLFEFNDIPTMELLCIMQSKIYTCTCIGDKLNLCDWAFDLWVSFVFHFHRDNKTKTKSIEFTHENWWTCAGHTEKVKIKIKMKTKPKRTYELIIRPWYMFFNLPWVDDRICEFKWKWYDTDENH